MRAEALRARLGGRDNLVAWPAALPETFVSVATDSRAVEAGSLFIAYRGATQDGHAYLAAAMERGATAAIVERPVPETVLPQIQVRNGRLAAAAVAALFYGDPASRLLLLAVTGTNGKTTTAHLLRHLFGDTAPAGSIGTLGAIDGAGNILPGSGNLTTPGPLELQATLAALHGLGVRTVAMETSSHSLDQDRAAGLSFEAAVYTNFTRDHLDYHKDEASYLEAKLKLSGYLGAHGWEIVNADVPAWQRLAPRERRLTFGIAAAADVRGSALKGDQRGSRFNLTARGTTMAATLPLIGRFNVENALGAAAAAIALGRDVEPVVARLATTPQVPGRMERVAQAPCVVLRDYAHTPDALERAVAAVRPLTAGRLLLVFGCGGDRDRGKRAAMGEIAAKGASVAIVTSDNPRTENAEQIIDDIEEGMAGTAHLRIVDRRQAIARAVAMARPDDTILLAGKGHETYQIIGREKLPFDEAEVVREAVAALGAGTGAGAGA
jgi:UDP-N-acetylmuramoyl-L-alanyl-D-glutamate--2,6-diaminopimelate ligase